MWGGPGIPTRPIHVPAHVARACGDVCVAVVESYCGPRARLGAPSLSARDDCAYVSTGRAREQNVRKGW